MTRVLIRMRADGEVGQGHLGRCLPLAKAFRDYGAEPYLAMESDSPYLQVVAAAGLHTLLLPSWAPLDVRAAARQIGADAIVLDVHGLSVAAVGVLRADPVSLTSLSVIGDGVGLVDLVANPVAHEALALEPHLPRNPDLRVMAGATAAIVDRSRLAPLIGLEREAGLVVLTLGGGALGTDQIAATAECLAAIPLIRDIRVFVGKAFESMDELRARLHAIHDCITVQRNSPDFHRTLACARIAVCGFGTTMYEAAFLGTPAVVVPLSETHAHFARVAESHGFALSLSWTEGIDEVGLSAAVSRFLDDEPFYQRASAAGRAAVSSRAPLSVADAVLSIPRLREHT